MKRFLGVLLACCMVLSGCGAEDISSTDEPNTINGYEEANYEKFNSPAKENGLGGTPIYVEGTVETKVTAKKVLAFTLRQDDGNYWVVSVTDRPKKDRKIVDDVIDKYVRVFGEYIGYSEAYNMPGLAMSVDGGKLTVKNDKSGDGYRKVWDFDTYLTERTQNLGEESQKETEEVVELEPQETESPEKLDDFSEPEPFFSYSGTGDNVSPSVHVDEISYAHITSDGGGYFSVKGHYGESYDLLVNTTDPYDGCTLIYPENEYTFEITSRGNWNIELFKQGTSSTDSFSGTSDFVTPVFLKTSDVYEIITSGGGYFAVKGWGDDGYDLLVNTTDENYSGKVMFDNEEKHCFFEITSSRAWEIKPSE